MSINHERPPLARFVRHSLWFMLCLSMLAAGTPTRASGGSEYVPMVGQPGKNVEWLPTCQLLVDTMLDMAEVSPEDYVMDLGSGDGRTVITAAKRGARALGIEYNADMVALSKRNAAREGVSDNALFVKGDLFEIDFQQATVITMFLLPEINMELRPRILDLKPGTRIVSNTFTMGDWMADQTVILEEKKDCNYYTALLWVVPAKVEGTWKLAQGELKLEQQYQVLSGTLTSGAKTMPVTNGKLSGDLINFSVGDANYTGRVLGGAMEGTFQSGRNTTPWTATKVVGRLRGRSLKSK
jgi:hypothetical protein